VETSGFFAHELRNLINTALIAFEVVKTGNVGVTGSTGTVLHRSLMGACDLVARSLAGIRLTQGAQHPEHLQVSQFIEELTEGATLAADAQRVTLTVLPVEAHVAVEADRQVLAAVVMNLLQNAFKFTRPRTSVTLRVGTAAELVLFEVQDECGGLPGGDVDGLFRPFEQRGADRAWARPLRQRRDGRYRVGLAGGGHGDHDSGWRYSAWCSAPSRPSSPKVSRILVITA